MPSMTLYKKIMSRMVPAKSGFSETSEDCTSFAQLKRICEEDNIVMTRPLTDTLIAMLATIVSVSLEDGDQIFLRVIAPASSGKTIAAEAISGAKRYVVPRSKFTGFHSGWSHGGKSSSFLDDLRNKVLVIKDADTIFNGGDSKTILSELRDLYDGASRSEYRNNKKNIYEDIRLGVILCGTDVLRVCDDASLGERFLDIEIDPDEESKNMILERVFSNANLSLSSQEKKEKRYKAATVGFINHLKAVAKEERFPIVQTQHQSMIIQMARLLSVSRARVHRDKEHLRFRAREEEPYRIIAQLVKMAGCMGFVLGEREYVGQEVIRILKKIVFDTAKGLQYDILKAVLQNPGINRNALAIEVNLAPPTVSRYLDDLRELNAVRRGQKNNGSGQKGRDLHCWFPTERLQNVVEILE